MITSPLLVHIGYHKTATTWMQRKLFIPEHGYQPIFDHQDVFNYIVQPHGLVFRPETAKKAIEDVLTRVKVGESGVVSSEILSGHPFFGGRESDILAKRLADIVPEARILISIRDQMRILPSVYMQYLLRGGTMNHVQFFKGKTDIQYFAFSPDHFKYHRLVKLYQELFGKERVLIITQESLRNNQDDTLQRLASFSGNRLFSSLKLEARKSVGESYPEYAAPIFRRINHVQTSTLNPQPIISFGRTPKGLYKLTGYVLKNTLLSKLLKDYKPVSSYVRQEFADYFVESNRILADLVGSEIDLTDYAGVEK